MAKKKSFREEVAEQFVKTLEEQPLEWHKSWQSTDTGRAINITTNKPYKGVNSFWLKYKEYNHGYGDNRWATFKQIKDKGWKLAKGSKGEKVEFYMPIDNSIGKTISWDKYNNLSDEEKGEIITKENGDRIERYSFGTKVYTVFNASQIEGTPKLDLKLIKNDIKADEIVQRIAKGMKVEIREVENSNKPSYSPSGDYITMPKASQFNSDYDYAATALHELGHSTGHESRLNRDLTGGFGSKKYAYEELIVEITSTFMSEYVEIPITEDNIQQHKAYIQSWISAIRNNKNYLFKAIAKAEEASDYMIEKGELDKILEKDSNIKVEKEVGTDYMMLGRLASDCEYYLGAGGQDAEHALYYHNEEKHIEEMKKLYDKLPDKPEWLSEEKIKEYEKLLLNRVYLNVHNSFVHTVESKDYEGTTYTYIKLPRGTIVDDIGIGRCVIYPQDRDIYPNKFNPNLTTVQFRLDQEVVVLFRGDTEPLKFPATMLCDGVNAANDEYLKNKEQELSKSVEKEVGTDYMMLGKLVSDCEYYLGAGGQDAEHALYYHNEEKHIEEMKKLYDKLPDKPEWLYEEIKECEKLLLNKETDILQSFNDRFYKFGVVLTSENEVRALTHDGGWTTWFDRNGNCKGNTDQLNIWLSDRGNSDYPDSQQFLMPTCGDALEMVESIAKVYGITIPEAQLGNVIDLEDFGELNFNTINTGTNFLKEAEKGLHVENPVEKLKEIFNGKEKEIEAEMDASPSKVRHKALELEL